MRFLYLLLTFFFLILTLSVFGQPCPPPGFPNSGSNCGSPIICENLDGYCTEINNSNQPRNYPCCAGWQLNNDEWFGFFAGTTTITLEITPSNCDPGGQQGLQAAIYDNCPAFPPPGGWCAANLMDAQCSCTDDPFQLTATDFVVGEVYWFVIDGCSGNVCDYEIQVLEGSTQGFPPDDPGVVTGPSPFCQGTAANYNVPPVSGATIYTWTLSPSSAGTLSNNNNHGDITVTWAAGFSGTATLCVKTSNLCFSNPDESCITVEVLPKPTATISGTGVLCTSSGNSIDLTVTLTGDPEWRFVYAINGVPQPAITTSNSPYIITITQPGTYTLVSVSSLDSDPDCTGTVSGNVVINQVTLNPSSTTVSAICGMNNGSLDLSVAGNGSAPYQYSWSSGQTTQDLSSAPPGTYTATVTDNNGCTATHTATINDNISAPVLSTVIVNNTTCTNGNGSIDLSVTPTSNNTYTWSGGQTTQDLANLLPGTYTVTVTQGVTCTATGSYTVADNPNLPVPTAIPTQSTCNLANGSVNASVTGGVAPYTYAWSNGATTEDLTNILAGGYTLTVTGANGCTQTVSINVSNNEIQITLAGTTQPNTLCNNSGNGSIDLTPTPAVPPAPLGSYTYTWSDGSTSQDPTNLLSGSYTVTVSAGGTCTAVASYNVADTPNRPVPAATPTGSTCNLSNGSIDANASGGVAPYTYAWSSGQTTQDLANIPPGNYTLTVTGANGCTQTISVNVPNTDPPITVTGTTVPNTACTGGNGSIDITATPADPNYTYVWSNGSTEQDLINLPPGSYSVTVSAGGTCTRAATFSVVDNPNLPNPTAIPTQSTCDLANGSINASVTGGVAPYTFAWSNGATTEDLANIPAGNYSLTVTGANGCTRVVNVNVGNNNPPINLSATTQANTACTGGNGSIDLTAAPAGPPYTYTWSNGATDQDLSNLPPGNYTVTVSAGGTCTAVATYNVADNPNLPTPTATPTQSTCDLPNGSIDASVTGGVAPYTYAWSNGATTQDITNLAPGSYSLTVTGANGCTRVITVTVGNNNPPINLTATIVANTLCNGGNGSIDLTAAPAGPPYTYNWSNGATTQDISSLPPGNYTVTVSAGGSCTATATYNVPDGPSVPIPTATTVQSTCDLANGSIDLSVSGGVPPYTYAWSNGATTQDISGLLAGTYMVTVTAANGCSRIINVTVTNNNPPINLTSVIVANTFCTGGNGSIDLTAAPAGPPYTYIWSNGPTTQDISGLPPGNYTVTVSAGGSCTATATYNVPDNPNQPIPTATPTQSTCNLANGSIDASVSGGVAPYTYAWSNGATTQDLSGLLSGSYTLTVTGANGCTRSITVDVGNNNPPINLTSVIVANTTCTGGNGSIDLTAAPAGPPYTYTWSNGATTQDISSLIPGDYTVTVSAGGTCTAVATYTVPNNPNLPLPTATPTQSTCSQSNGSIDANVTGGVAPYTYLWSYNNATSQDLTNIPAGNYVLTVTGANGCTNTVSVDVGNNNPPINVTATSMPNTVCNASPNGSINITVTPPNPGYTFFWSNGTTTEDLTGVAQGDYSVTVTLLGTCTQVATFTVPDNPNSPQITPSVVNTSCDFANGSINIVVNGGPTPYTYLWAPGGETTQNLSSIPAGTYQVTVTATNGCTGAADITVSNNNPPINLSGTVLPNVTCNNNPTGSINLTAGPAPNYTYTWSNGATTQDINNLPPGDYTVTVSSGGSCIEFATFNVPDIPNAPTTTAIPSDANCGLPNGSINLTPSGGVPPYTYAWSSGQTTQDLANITGGIYQVVVTGSNGCTAEEVVIVDNNDIPIDIDAVVIGKTSCVANNGSISITVTPTTASVLWSNGSTSKNLLSLSPGNYTVTVSMGGTCTVEATYSINDESELPILSADVLPAICGFNNGSVDLSADFGIPPYTYDWAHIPGVSNAQDLINLTAGNYAVTVTTSVGCSDVFFAPVDNELIPIDIYFQTSDDLSCTSDNGYIDLDVEPMLNYTYDWVHIQGANNPQDLINLSAGTYTVTVSFGTCNASVFLDIYDATEPPSVSISNTAAICGQSNGTVTLNVTGATAPYSFNWAHIPGTNNPQNLSNLAPGTYNVTVTDFYDCTATAFTTVVNNLIVLNLSGVPVANTSCAAPNGALDVSVVPAGNYNYIWNNGATTQDLTGIAPGLYGVTASAGVGCTSAATFQVTNNTVNPQLNPIVTAAICSQNNGDIQITTTSGTTPYTFLWSNAATTEDLNNIFPGNYTLTVTDANGCTADTILNVANNATTFSLSGTATDYSSCASINGAIDLTITPVGPYIYLWSGGETTQDLNNLPAGAYTVQVTESGTCIASATYFVQDVRTWPTLNQSIAAELCNLTDGSVDISIFGGLGPFIYAWSSGETTEDLSNIPGGTYTIIVTGATNGCSETITALVPENDIAFSLTASIVPNSSCVVLNGSVDLVIAPGVPSAGPGYTYTWSGGFTTQDLNPVPAGTYAVTVSAGGTCTNTASYVVDDAAGAPSIGGSVTQALCGQSSGSVNIGISGGAAPYSFNWSTGATSEDLANVLSGPYAVTVTGSNGCQISGSYNVPENVVIPTLSGIPQPNTACVGPNGSINMSISPSTLNYTINWSTGATSQNLSNLTAGTYTVSVYGGGACTASATYIIDNASLAVTAGGTEVDVLCFGNSTGSIDLVTNGGTQPFVFTWNPSSIGNIEDPSSLPAGVYGVTITDAVGCSTTASFNITQPPNTVQAACAAVGLVSQPGFNDGKAQVQISGGAAPYTILWSPGGTQNGIAAGIFPLNNLGVGQYGVTVTDANGCTTICGFNILLSPCSSAVGSMGTAQLSHCSTGCITANYNGLGQVLDPDDVLQFILHLGPDSLIVGEKARSSTPTFCFNPATMTYGTTYYVSAVVGSNDGNGNVLLAHYCTVIATGTPIVFYEKPVASAAVPEPITCATLQVSILGSSNLPNPTFQWSTSNGNIVGPSNQANIEADDAGNYRLIVGVNGCLDTTIAVVLDIRNDPSAQILASPNDILDCIIDEIVLAGEIKGSSDANTVWYDQNGVIYSGGTVLQIDDPGTYWFAIVDTVTFCSDTASITIGQDQLYPPLFINPPATLTCDIGSVTLSGGSPINGILFRWATVIGNDTTILGTGTSVVVTQPNTYRLFGYDPVNGCNNSLSTIVVTDQTYPTANAGPPFNIDCFGQNLPINGTATGGTGTLVYSWTTSGGVIVSGANTLTPIVSEPGTYTLLVTASGNGCSDTDVVVLDPNEPQAIATVDNPACYGYKGSILVDTVLGAKPPLQYTFTGGPYLQSGNLFTNLSAGAYSIFIVDANGCSTSLDATVVQPDEFIVTVEPQVLLQLGDSYQVDATVNIPDDEIASIQWTPPTWLSCDTCLSTRIDTPLQTQLYNILVVTKEGCRDDAPLLLRVNKNVSVYIPNVFSPNDDGENDWFTVFADIKGVKQVKTLQIFDRWGDQLFINENFQPNDPTLGWDGRFRGQDMNPAVFVYYAIVEFIDGQEVLFKGDVTIVR